MTPEINDRIASMLSWLEASAKNAEGFALEQAPLVAREIVQWQLISNTVYAIVAAVVSLLLIACGVACVRKAIKLFGGDSYHEDAGIGLSIAAMVLLVPAAFLLTSAVFRTVDATKAAVAPRLVIIDYIRNGGR